MASNNNLREIIASVQSSMTSDNFQELIAQEVGRGSYFLGDTSYFADERLMRNAFPSLTEAYEVAASLDFEILESHSDDYNKVTYAKLTLRVYTDEEGNDVALVVATEQETTLACKD